MNKNVMIAGIAAVTIGVASVVASQALAYKGDPTVKGPNYTPERHEAMLKAFENKDYKAWRALMEGRGVVNRITEENFGRFVEAHNLELENKTEEANKIYAELGLRMRNGSGKGMGNGQGRGDR